MQESQPKTASPYLTLFPLGSESPKSVCVVAETKDAETAVLGLLEALGVRPGAPEDARSTDPREAKPIRCLSAGTSADPADLLRQLEAPCLILASEGLAARAERLRKEEQLTGRHALASALSRALEKQRNLLDFADAAEIPALLVSTDAVLGAPSTVLRGIAEFLHLEAPSRAEAPRPARPSTALAALIDDGGRVSIAPYDEDISAADSLYASAAAALQRGNHEEAQGCALAIVGLFARDYPSLAEGPLGPLAEASLGIGPERVYPDHVCTAYFLLGFSDFLLGNFVRAHAYLSMAERLARRRMELNLAGPLSRTAYWHAVLYSGLAAKRLQRSDLVEWAKHRIAQAVAPGAPEEYSRLRTEELNAVAKVAAAEL